MYIFKFLKNKINKDTEQVNSNINEQQASLMPTTINEKEPQYLPVKEIGNKLKSDQNIRNIALTGPYGSGKSSVLKTLQKDFPYYKYLQISLATLEPYNVDEECRRLENECEKLNRIIEYSILQQLIYREKFEKLPNSRFRRIFHFNKSRLITWSLGIVGFFIAFIVAFEPEIVRVDAMYKLFYWGTTCNTLFDIVSVLYMIIFFFICVKKSLLAFCGYKLNKLNLKDGEIELHEETSIFNKHLDEIIYFFQVTDYNIVIIEDLDRFNTSDIYLKLRELNQLINDSKEIGRHIVFIYAVKDDVFKDAQRTKFFDYITTVIPLINPSNSKDKLKEELHIRGYDDIADEDLEEIAFFVDDMRLLRNIANEYQQYRKRLCSTNQSPLNPTKLLGMIVYKNFFPNDFALLHNRKGKVYQCISSKEKFLTYAKQNLVTHKSKLKRKIQEYQKNIHLRKRDLRMMYAFWIQNHLYGMNQSFNIDGKSYSFEDIVNEEEVFEKFISIKDNISYSYSGFNHYTSLNSTCKGNFKLNLSEIDQKVSDGESYWERKRKIEVLFDEIQSEKNFIVSEETRIKTLKLMDLLASYDMTQCGDFIQIALEPMMNVFLRRGYIDEEYYDYISYFYEGTITQSDRELMLAMKQNIKNDYQKHIDKIENFVKKIPVYVFNNNSVLNIDLVDFLISHQETYREKFLLIINRITKNDPPVDFIVQYYQNGKYVKELFKLFIEWDILESWSIIVNYKFENERIMLLEGWLKFCDTTKLQDEQKVWISKNYSFLTKHLDAIGLHQAKELSKEKKYITLNTDSSELLDFIIENDLYVLNKENICTVANYLNRDMLVNAENLNLTRIKKTDNNAFVSYVENNLNHCLDLFSNKIHDENKESLLFILRNEIISETEKVNYLINQKTHRILDINDVEDNWKSIAIKSFLIEPTWENIAVYFICSGNNITHILKLYIEHYESELGKSVCDDSVEVKDLLFKHLLVSNILNIDTFKILLNSFDNTIEDSNSLVNLESERVNLLINTNRIIYTKENTSAISLHPTETFVRYLIHNKRKYLQEIEDITYTYDLVVALLKSEELTNHEKSKIIPLISIDIIENHGDLATEICACLNKGWLDLDDDAFRAIIGSSFHNNDRIIVVSSAIKNNDKIDFIESLLNMLPSPYADIIEHDKKHPILENTDYNRTLLDQLKYVKYISSYSCTDKGLRVNKKVF